MEDRTSRQCTLTTMVWGTDTHMVRFFLAVASLSMGLFGLTAGDTLKASGYGHLEVFVTESGWVALFLMHGALTCVSIGVNRLKMAGSVYGLFIYLTMFFITLLESDVYPPMGCITAVITMLVWITARDAFDRKRADER